MDQQVVFAISVLHLHTALFRTLSRWESHIGLAPCLSTNYSAESLRSQHAIFILLCEISLYFLIWSEAANVRHLPEGICFLFWTIRNSSEFDQLVKDSQHNIRWVWRQQEVDLKKMRCRIRQSYQGLITQVRFRFNQLEGISTEDILRQIKSMLYKEAEESCIVSENIKNYITSIIELCRHRCYGVEESVVDTFIVIVLWLALNGDGGQFTDKIITPLMLYLTVEMDLKGEWDISQRVGYDDCNECFCDSQLVQQLLAKVLENTASTDKSGLYKQFLLLGANPLKTCQEIWQDIFFCKQFVERRSWLMLFRAFFRIFVLHVCLFHIMLMRGFFGWDKCYIMTVTIIHACLCTFVNLTETWLNRSITNRQEYFDSKQSDKHILVEMPSLSAGQEKQLQISGPPSRSSSIENRSNIDIQDLPIVNLRVRTSSKYSEGKPYYDQSTVDVKTGTQRLSRSDSFSWSASASTQKRRSQSTIFEDNNVQDGSYPSCPDEFELLNDDDLTQIRLYQQQYYGYSQQEGYSNLIMQWGILKNSTLKKDFSNFSYLPICTLWIIVLIALLVSFLKEVSVLQQIPQQVNWFGSQWIFASGLYIFLWLVLSIVRNFNSLVPCWLIQHTYFRSKGSVEEYIVQVRAATLLELFRNSAFWGVVLTAKVIFDYYLLVKPLVDSVDDLTVLQWLHTGGRTMPLFGFDTKIPTIDADLIPVVVRFIPPFLVSILDTGIFYIMVASCCGFFQGLMYLQLGLVYDWDGIVKCFYVAAQFWTEISSPANSLKDLYRSSSLSSLIKSNPSYNTQAQRQHCCDKPNRGVLSEVSWNNFRKIWNAIQSDFRARDFISNHELACLSFPTFSKEYDLACCLRLVDIQTPLLPAFIYRHHLQSALGSVSCGRQSCLVLVELKGLVLWVLVQVGLLSMNNFQGWMQTRIPFHLKNNVDLYRARSRTLSCLVKLLRYISQTYEEMDVQWLRSITFRLIESMQQIKQILLEKQHGDDNILNNCDNLLHKCKEELESLLSPRLPSQSVRELADFLRRILSIQESAMVPQNPTARHMLYFFMSSLFNNDLLSSSNEYIYNIPSWTTIIPHHKEEVLYSVMTPGLSWQHSSYDFESCEGGSQSWLHSSRSSALGSTFVGSSSKESVVMKIARNISFSRFERGTNNLPPELNTDTDGHVSIMQYLQSVYPLEWKNFLERLEVQRTISTLEIQQEMVLWASYRGQLLSRTVRGILCYQEALALLITFENPKPEGMTEQEYNKLVNIIVSSKFSLIVTSQHYGAAKKSLDKNDKRFSRSMEHLMQMQSSLRVAYIDQQADQKCEYAVLVCSKQSTGAIDFSEQYQHEIYRIRYPGVGGSRGIILGEGKPENQNHAIVFAFGELLQTVDMNQDNNLAEALKMRNLVTRFQPLGLLQDGQERYNLLVGNPYPSIARSSKIMHSLLFDSTLAQVGVTGFREYVFSDRVGALGSFAAATEFAFGTILQRVMYLPGRVRFHYGHPDIWNKFLVMTSGGVSKATRGFHISEDIFGGFNVLMRGYAIHFKEFISIGKGREMRFDSVNKFEQKISTGNGEQALSRDVKRLGQEMDFFRLMSFYHSSIGFFLNTAMLMFSVLVHIWVLLFLHLTKAPYVQSYIEEECIDQGYDIDAHKRLYDANLTNVQSCYPLKVTMNTSGVFSTGYVIALGIFSMMPFTMEMILEIGILRTMAATFLQLVAGAILFFIFKQQTSAYYFTQDLNHGGAQYLATGRGFALDRLSFVQVYSQFSRSHFYRGLQLLQFCIVLALLDLKDLVISTWGTWIVAIALLFSPIWFNPFSFSMSRVKIDFEEWRAWTKGVMAPSTLNTWQSWNDEQLEYYRNTTGKQINFWMCRTQGLLFAVVPRALMILAALSKYKASWILNSWIVFIFSTSTILLLLGLNSYAQRRVGFRQKRIYRTVAIAAFVVLCILYLRFYIGESGAIDIQSCVRVFFAHLQFALLLHNFTLYAFPQQKWIQSIVDFGYLLLDNLCGYIMFGVLFVFSYVQVVDKIQGALLFNMEFVKNKQRNKTLGKVVDQLRTFYDPDVINSPYPM